MTTKVLVTFRHPSLDSADACHQGLGITALNLVLSLRDLQVDADVFPIANGEYLWAQLAGAWADYTHVVLSAPFIDAAFLGKLVRHFSTKQFALVYHSNLGFLTQDRFAGLSIPQYLDLAAECPNFSLAANCRGLSDGVHHATGLRFLHLPNLYHMPHQVRRMRPAWRPGQVLNLGLFGAARVLKNWLTAGVAAMIIQRTLDTPVRLHISSGRDEGAQATRDILDGLLAMNKQLTVVAVPWLGHDDFRRYVYGMDLLLQPSYSETFNNVTADGCYAGVPSVVSEAISWAPEEWIAVADSADSVAQVGCHLLRDIHAAANGWAALDGYNRRSGQEWLAWLGSPAKTGRHKLAA